MASPGRLRVLATAVTDSTGNSITAVIPATGGPAVGDLLLAAAAIPSGSRTFTLPGGWTALGMAQTPGHGSGLWWKWCEQADVGAGVTATPSSGAVKMVLLLASITGADPAHPLGEPVMAASNTVTSTAAHTTPALAGVPAESREVSFVCDSRGAVLPQTAAWTAPAGMTRTAQTFTADGAQATSGACGDSDHPVSGTIGSRIWTADQAALGSAWTLAVHGRTRGRAAAGLTASPHATGGAAATAAASPGQPSMPYSTGGAP